jgi:glycosyltransferase involved in cell wall biosynthesis
VKVILINRKPRKSGNFSIESYFRAIYASLITMVDCSYFVSSRESNYITPRIKAILEVSRLRADVYHITGDVHFLTLGTPPAKTVLTIHDCGFMYEKHFLKRWFFWLFWLKIPVKRSRFVTCVSGATKSEIIRYTGCPPEKVTVIPTTVSERFIRYEKVFNERCPEILHIGTKPNKNLPRLIRALEGLDCRLTVIGELNDESRRLLEKCQVSYENHMDIDDNELLRHYIKSDVIAFVSTFEGFGMPIIEGQLIGRPVITANCSSMPEVAGGAAELVDPYNVNDIKKGLLKIIKDPVYREELVRKGTINAARFNTDTVARQYVDLYREIR